jgi:hypothetical protein
MRRAFGDDSGREPFALPEAEAFREHKFTAASGTRSLQALNQSPIHRIGTQPGLLSSDPSSKSNRVVNRRNDSQYDTVEQPWNPKGEDVPDADYHESFRISLNKSNHSRRPETDRVHHSHQQESDISTEPFSRSLHDPEDQSSPVEMY